MCFVQISEQEVMAFMYNINELDFINETERVYSAVRNVSLDIIQDKFR
jgi:hypothetical protein